MSSTSRSRRPGRPEPDDLTRRLAALLEGLTVARVIRADATGLVVDMTDGTRLLVSAPTGLDISVT
jgi:hypothetical protein